jgi:hypothetical protein
VVKDGSPALSAPLTFVIFLSFLYHDAACLGVARTCDAVGKSSREQLCCGATRHCYTPRHICGPSAASNLVGTALSQSQDPVTRSPGGLGTPTWLCVCRGGSWAVESCELERLRADASLVKSALAGPANPAKRRRQEPPSGNCEGAGGGEGRPQRARQGQHA